MKKVRKNIAAVDVGTNSFHLIVVEAGGPDKFEIIDREREVIRLGEGNPGDIKTINPDAMKRAIKTLKSFKGISDSHSAPLRAVATSAVRESSNKNEFIKRVWEETGVEIEIISGHEEARLIYLGVLKSVPIFDIRTLVIDIGGGSTEFLIGEKGKTLFSVSLKLGAVRLMQKFLEGPELTDESIQECRNWIHGELFNVAEAIKEIGFDSCVGSSGTIMATGFMIEALQKGRKSNDVILNNYEFAREDFLKIRDEVLKRKTEEKRRKIPGLDDKRADIIPAGIIILDEIFELLNLKRMMISSYALREGIIIDTLQKEFSESIEPVFSDIRKNSIKHLAESFEYDHHHCEFVASLSVQLYDQLKPLHMLDDKCREYLYAAALLHDIGYQISHTNHHHHSFYIIKNSEMLGFNETEISVIAHVARYHRKSHPKQSHDEFSSLTEKTQTIIKKLAAILRVVDALDRTHSNVILRIDSAIKKNEVILKLVTDELKDPEIELWNLERRKGLFEEVFFKKIEVEIFKK
ncbi:MAG: exopolyphosphatase [Ignavibacteriae bacterium HGW-Ignavibacteriae-3]|nr:MAG: exopolyphosphatase [Ignavibacteriae bacterium HGW-Ignavibacteriae-3]